MSGRSVIPISVLAAMIDWALAAPAGRPIVEVGVYRGGSALELAAVARHKGVGLHLFDTFAGMPFAAADDKHQVGDFSDTSLTEIQRLIPIAHCHAGIFPQTLPRALTDIGFAHIDVDQYRSTIEAIDALWPRMAQGGIMWFDDVELEPARRAIYERFHDDGLQRAPEGRLFVIRNDQ